MSRDQQPIRSLHTADGSIFRREPEPYHSRVADFVPIQAARKTPRACAKSVHPCRRREIDSLHAAGNGDGLQRFSHIFVTHDLEYLPPPPARHDHAGFEAEYLWESGREGFGVKAEPDDESFDDEQFAAVEEECDHNFFQAVKLKAYGTLTVELPFYYLEDFEEIEMAECNIHSLEGVEYCIHAKILDISGNAITDIADLRSLLRVTELYASGNRIGYIDALSSLLNLRILDLSVNENVVRS